MHCLAPVVFTDQWPRDKTTQNGIMKQCSCRSLCALFPGPQRRVARVCAA